MLAVGGVLVALVIAGCGGSSNPSPAASGVGSTPASHPAPAGASGNAGQKNPPAPSSEMQTSPKSVESGGIPQHNGGDQDADNNGGPSDGDGNI